jgi:hypothetical protein
MALTIEQLKKTLLKWKDESPDDWANVIETLTPIKQLDDLVDGNEITWDCKNHTRTITHLSTSETACTINIQNFGKKARLVIQNLAVPETNDAEHEVIVTLQGTNLKFLTVDDETGNEIFSSTKNVYIYTKYKIIELNDSGIRDNGDIVIV